MCCCCCSAGGCIECVVVVAVLVGVLSVLLLQCWWMSSSTWMTSRCGWPAVCVDGGDRFCLRRRPKTSGITSSVSAGHSSGHRVASSVGGQSTPSCELTPVSPTVQCLGKSFSSACSCPTRVFSLSEQTFYHPLPLLLFDTV